MANDLVLLDAEADAYFCLPDGGRGAGLDFETGEFTTEDDEVRQSLEDAGLIIASAMDGGDLRRIPPPRPTRSAIESTSPPPELRDLKPAAIAVLDLLLHYRGRPFAEAVAFAATTRLAATPSGDLLEIVRRFRAWAPYAPTPAKCLIRSFMLMALLRRAGHDPRWIFGVAAWPFRAHCWLQCGDLVLDDSVEHLSAFTPILVA